MRGSLRSGGRGGRAEFVVGTSCMSACSFKLPACKLGDADSKGMLSVLQFKANPLFLVVSSSLCVGMPD